MGERRNAPALCAAKPLAMRARTRHPGSMRRLSCALLFVLCLGVATWRAPPLVLFNPSPSVPEGFYLRTDRAPQRVCPHPSRAEAVGPPQRPRAVDAVRAQKLRRDRRHRSRQQRLHRRLLDPVARYADEAIRGQGFCPAPSWARHPPTPRPVASPNAVPSRSLTEQVTSSA